MRVPVEWLTEFVPIRLAPEALAERLTMAGLEVTGLERVDGKMVFDLEITPNRADCLSIIGIAREVAALTGARLRLPAGAKDDGRKTRAPSPIIHLEDRQGCSRYVGRLMTSIQVGPSPAWMQQRLVACGLRPINNIVDITNYVLLEWGQPLHAFDFDRLSEGTVVVRRARADETLVTIDGELRALTPEHLVIADAKRPIAIAGVMGGRDTQITDSTKRLLLESAWFDPTRVRRTARALRLASESSYRFERGVDPTGVARASLRASRLIEELAHGREVAVKDVGRSRPTPTGITLDAGRINRLAGAPLQTTKTARALQALGFGVRRRSTHWDIQVPSHRSDVKQDVDVLEELARVFGYDRLPTTVPSATPRSLVDPSTRATALAVGPRSGFRPAGVTEGATGLPVGLHETSSHTRSSQGLRRLCASLGLVEVVTWSLVSSEHLKQAGCSADQQQLLRLVNPLSYDHAVLRPTLLVGILQTASKHFAQGALGVRCFEIGHVFSASPKPSETLHLALGLAGVWERTWQGKQDADLYRLKGLVEQLVSRCVRQPITVQAMPMSWAEPGHSMQVLVDRQPIGVMGQVAQSIREAFDLDKPVWIAELKASRFLDPLPSPVHIEAPSPFPPVKRDLSFSVGKHVDYTSLFELIRTIGSPLTHRIDLIDRYTGPQVHETHQSLTFSIEYRDPSRTLTAAEVDRLHQHIGQELIRRFGAQLR